jgi:formylmethanofuran dehydrogenase subunit E
MSLYTWTERNHCMKTLAAILEVSAARHSHLCPKQVLGARMGLLAGVLLALDLPQNDKRLLAILETDGCSADGISVATGCSIGHRTLRVEDYGKVAATFVDTRSERALRIVPRPEARALAAQYAGDAQGRWRMQLTGYQRMPDALLLAWQEVALTSSIASIVSRPHLRVDCRICGEEIINQREVVRDGIVLCRACADGAYYSPVASGELPLSLQPREPAAPYRG